ncbi:helix-turn-helix transcriptional regulator [Oscillatoria sp. FACHB-1406]|uniref:helix-turn-helix transcriptional regulator n=1 Tax=Oscillatoria sp. FACHB-1406 TaxID=2692846 RepID=UPI0016820304|nr:helix-turn-helix transcriptional regulator [Oscillatoria sp. FACHB-1406]MBD2578230.1 helix-turn-helix transcriptional regulator [Oscillatoria sp. FACHB-1406]
MPGESLPRSEELKFKQLRENAGLSQEALARALDVTSKTVSNWERGVSPASLTIPQVKTLCKLLNITLEELPDLRGPNAK